jgi:hypothetical protein
VLLQKWQIQLYAGRINASILFWNIVVKVVELYGREIGHEEGLGVLEASALTH